jgi:TonB-linked SusC/RagA family outer membrane protein
MLLAVCLTASAQNRTVTGKVTDEKGNPIEGVSVTTPDGKLGTQTDKSGDFRIEVPAGVKTLNMSSVNFEQAVVGINNRNSASVSLTSADKALSEVMVVGYGTQKRRNVTASMTRVNPNNFNTLATTSIDQQLAGRAAGLQVTNSSGLVNQAPRIRIRGVNSINQGRDPLIVLDGVPTFSGGYSGAANTNVLSDINPADIESIEVLKDGSATAIYGSRAANGVILINTKKGRSGKANVTYNATFGFSKPLRKFDLLNADQFITIANEKLTNAGLAAAAFKNSENTNTDWQDVAMRSRANTMLHSLSLDGGNDRTTYFMSFSFNNNQGIIRTNQARRYGIRMNIEHKVNDWLKVGNNITLSRSEDNDQNNGGNALSGAVANALRALPNVRAFDPANTAFAGYNIKSDGSALGRDANTRDIENNYTNLAFVLDNNRYNSTRYRIINNAFAEVRLMKGLSYRLQAAVDYNNGTDFIALDPRHGDGRSSGGIVSNQSLTRNRYVVTNLLTYNKSFGEHNLTAVAGYEIQRDESSSSFGEGRTVSDIFFLQQNIISGSYVNQFSGGGFAKSGLTSFFGRVNYDFRNRYYLQLSARNDGQSSLAEPNRYGFFPAVSAGWRVSEESFWKNTISDKWVSDFKIRASYGVVGNPLGGFPFLSTYSSAQYGGINGIAVSNVGNPGLQWETNKKFDVGFDATLFKGRINLTFDYFRNNNDNLVLAAPLPVSFGVPNNSIFKNIGSSVNKGFEVTIGGTVMTRKDFSWDVSFNYTNTKNQITSLYLNQDIIGNYNIIRVGQPINAIFGYTYAGVNSGNGNPMYVKADGKLIQGNIANSSYFEVVKPDDATLGNPAVLAATDRSILGNALPTFFGGLSQTFRYKGFQLDVFFRYSGGNFIFNQTAQESLFNQGFTNNGTEILDRWTTAGQQTNVPRLWYGRENFINLNQSANSRFVEKGDFLKLENVALSYSLNRNTLQQFGKGHIKSVRFFLQGQNLWLLSKFSGIDPENITEAGINYNVVPSARNISFGLSVGL